MPSGATSDPKVEIAHVLTMDVVEYSTLLITDQTRVMAELTRVVKETARFRRAEAEGKLIRLPTGDGMLLVFFDDPHAPIECAMEIATAMKSHPGTRLRMGIHSGPVNEVVDVNDRSNVAGAGVDMAQRVMDCGDAGHILLSKRVADDLTPFPRWNPHLYELGECEIKHGRKISLINFYTDEVGNPKRPEKLKVCAEAQPSTPNARSASPRMVFAIGAIVLLFLFAGGWWFLSHRAERPAAPQHGSIETTTIPEKSIAVLPFENLSEDKANSYFANGVQDEILTNLAKIADLKVISRTSVMQYRTGIARNLREIGRQLGVAHLLEGSVQRAEGKVRVNAQLIDARTDAHLWAQTYDRDLADVFAIQSDIAGAIAEQLQAKLAPEEKTRLATKPTDNPEAYLLYLQANELIHVAASKVDAVNADNVYAQAIALDPNFALARARASMLNSLMYSLGRDPMRQTKARTLADEALRLAPDLGEAHIALGLCFYRLDRAYDRALKELAIASAALPNNSEILDFSGFIYRRQGRWREALAAFERANKLDPRRAHLDGMPETLRVLRQWGRASDAYRQALQLEPQLTDGWIGLAYAQFAQSGAPSAARTTLDHLPDAMKNKPLATAAMWDYAMLTRDFATAEKLIPDDKSYEFPVLEPAIYFQACIASAQADVSRAHHLLEEIRPLHEAGARDHPDDPTFHAALGKVYSLLGQKEGAIREARRAVELCPESKDAVSGAVYATDLAFVYAQSGEVEKAVTLLSRLLTTPAAERITLAHLRLSWEWDPLRKDPRFQKILEGPESETVYK
jgi:TolB-like protein/Flp pilus assembly protein TadD